jgi:hypothetical protein
MSHVGNGARPDALRTKLIGLAQLIPTKPSWLEILDRLGENPTAEEQVAAYQAVRAAGVVPPAAGFYLVAWAIDLAASDRIVASIKNGALQRVEKQMHAFRQAQGLEEDEDWDYPKLERPF